jgi:hypothetical protein
VKRWLALSVLAATRVASADGHHIMVLRAEGTADAATRSKIDTQILKLAKNADGNAEAGDITFADASAAAGCSASEASCKDEVLGMLGVDEIVAVTVNNGRAGTEITVRRLPKTGMPHEAHAAMAAGQSTDAKVNVEIGPLFGVNGEIAATSLHEGPVGPIGPTPPPNTHDTHDTHDTQNTHDAQPPRSPQVTVLTAAPNGQITDAGEDRHDNRRLHVAGLAVGGGLALLGLLMWAEASSTQGDIDAAPTRTLADFQNLQDLQSRADTFASLGNVMFVGGVLVGGIAGYLYWRDRRAGHSSHQAHLAPAVFDHGAGLTLSFGGAP